MALPRSLALALCFLVTLTARDVAFRDAFALADIGETAISPNGANVLFTVNRRHLRDNRTESLLMEIPAPGGQAMLVRGAPEGASQIRWTADSKRIAFIAAKAIWVLEPATGKSHRVCAYDRSNSFLSKTGNALSWSPDGRWIAFAGTSEPWSAEPGTQLKEIFGRAGLTDRFDFGFRECATPGRRPGLGAKGRCGYRRRGR